MRGAQLVAHAAGEILRQHLDGRVGDGKNHAITGRKDITRLALERHVHAAVFLRDRELGIVARQEHAMIELRRQRAHDLFHGGKVHDEPAVLLEAPFHEQAGPIVVPVEFFAAVSRERDEVRGREDQIFFRDGYGEFAAGSHTPRNLLGGSSLAGCQPPHLVRQPLEPLLGVIHLGVCHGLGAAGNVAGVRQQLVQRLPERPVAPALRSPPGASLRAHAVWMPEARSSACRSSSTAARTVEAAPCSAK